MDNRAGMEVWAVRVRNDALHIHESRVNRHPISGGPASPQAKGRNRSESVNRRPLCLPGGAVMGDISVKRFNWVRSPTFRERNEAWRARQQELRENFESANSAANNTLFTASINLVTGLGAIIAQRASQRAQAEAIARQFNILA
jgi:hypothetical protein